MIAKVRTYPVLGRKEIKCNQSHETDPISLKCWDESLRRIKHEKENAIGHNCLSKGVCKGLHLA